MGNAEPSRHRDWILSLALIAVCPAAEADGVLPNRVPVISTPEEPSDLVAGDLDADGWPDLIACFPTSDEVWTMAGRPFGVPHRRVVGFKPVAIAVCDADGDGRLDVVTANALSMDVSLCLGRGDGSLDPAYSLRVPGSPAALAAADFDGDRRPDLVVAAAWEPALWYFPGDLAWGTVAPRSIPLPEPASKLCPADFDGDGDLDIVAGMAGGFTVLLGDGDGTFPDPHVVSGDSGAVALRLVDLDGDGRLDLISSEGRSLSRLQVFRGLGGGRFERGQTVEFFEDARRFEVLDFDGDGYLDLVAPQGGRLRVCHGESGGSFAKGEPPIFPNRGFPGFNAARRLLAAEFDGDGRTDLVIAGALEWFVLSGEILRGEGSILRIEMADSGGTLRFGAAEIADIDGDGAADVAVGRTGEAVRVLHRFRGMTFIEAALDVVFPRESNAFTFSDVDGDARADALLFERRRLTVHLATGPFAFGPAQAFAYPMVFSTPSSIADLTGDGRPEVVLSDMDLVTVMRNDGPGAFPQREDLAIPFPSPIAGDFDADGVADLIIFEGREAPFRAHRWDPAGGLHPVGVPGYVAFAPPLAGDLDGDGAAELLAVASDGIRILRSAGADEFQLIQTLPRPAADLWESRAVLGDFDRDGPLDLILASKEWPFLFLARGETGGVLREEWLRFWTNHEVEDVRAGDVDGDGDLDLATLGWKARAAGETAARVVRIYYGAGGSRPPGFTRGEVSSDGTINISDAVVILMYLFAGGSASCLDAADVDDSGGTDLADAIRLLMYLFADGPAPAAPFPACGLDPTPADAVDCALPRC